MGAPSEVEARRLLIGAYSSDKWKKRVEKMSGAQVIAIYSRLKSQNKL